MSGTILFRPTGAEKAIAADAPDAFRVAMTKVFGSPPWQLDCGALQKLEAMAAVTRDKHNPFEILHRQIEKYDVVIVRPDY